MDVHKRIWAWPGDVLFRKPPRRKGEAVMDVHKRIWTWPAFGPESVTGTWSANTYYDENTAEYILAAEHDRIVAEKDAEIAMLRQCAITAVIAITEAPGGHWATRDNEPDSRTDPEGHRDWQRDRDAQREEGTW